MVSYEELKQVGFVKLIELKILGIFSIIYDFFKDNSGFLKETVESVETKVISIMEPVTKMLNSVFENTLGFIDEKFDKYAPSFIKSLLGIFSSFIKEKISFVEKVFGPLVDKAKTLLEKGLSTIESLFLKCYNFQKSEFKRLVSITETIIEKSLSITKQMLEKTKVIVTGIPIIGDATQSFITIQIDKAIQIIETTASSITEYGIFGAITSATQSTTTSIIQKSSELIIKALETTKMVLGGIPIIGDATESIITKEESIIIQWTTTTTSSINEYGIVGTITSGVQHVVKETTTIIIEKGSESISQALDTTKWVVGSIPIIGDTAQSIITKEADIVSQLIDTTTSSIKENGIFGAISSVTENVVKQAQESATSIIQKGSESVSQALDTTKSVVGGIPIIGEAAQSIITKPTDMASQLIDTTTSSIKENGIFGAISLVTENVVKQAQESTTSIIQKGSESVSQALDTTKSVVGGIPIIGEAAQSIITTQTDMASQLIDSTTSSVKENGIFGAIISAAGNAVKGVQETSSSIIQKGSESVSQALDTTKSVVGGIPIIGEATQSIITKPTDMASQLIDTTTSSVKENGIFGAIVSAAGNAVKGVQETSSSIIQKGSESVSQALDTTKSVVGGIPIIGEAAQSVITKPTDIASQLIDNTTSSVKENGIFGAIISAAGNAVKGVQETSSSIIQKGSESVTQALDTTKSVVGGIPIIGEATQSVITTQTDKVSEVVEKSTSSVKKKGLFGSLLSVAGSVVEDVGNTSKKIVEKSAESQKNIAQKLFGF